MSKLFGIFCVVYALFTDNPKLGVFGAALFVVCLMWDCFIESIREKERQDNLQVEK